MTDERRDAPPTRSTWLTIASQIEAIGRRQDTAGWATLIDYADLIREHAGQVSETEPQHDLVRPLRYLLDSTAPDGQWADQAVHSFVKTLLKNAAPQARGKTVDSQESAAGEPGKPAEMAATPNGDAGRWMVFCGICKVQWSVGYQHPGKSVCDDCVKRHSQRQRP